jgi:hypothetical protein
MSNDSSNIARIISLEKRLPRLDDVDLAVVGLVVNYMLDHKGELERLRKLVALIKKHATAIVEQYYNIEQEHYDECEPEQKECHIYHDFHELARLIALDNRKNK